MNEFKIGDLVELKDEYLKIHGYHSHKYYEITNISKDKSMVFATIHHKDTCWGMSTRLKTEWLKHYKMKTERTSIYDKF